MSVPKIWRKQEERYNLVGTIDPINGDLFFPPRTVTKNTNTPEKFHFSGNGTIVSYTIIRTNDQNIDSENIDIPARNMPYALAIIELDEKGKEQEHGPRLTAEIVDSQFSEIEIGKKVKMVFRKIATYGKKGVIQYGYKFILN